MVTRQPDNIGQYLAWNVTECCLGRRLKRFRLLQGREAKSAATKAARKGSEVAQEKGADLWGFTKAKAQEVLQLDSLLLLVVLRRSWHARIF